MRTDGRKGIRNLVLVIYTVECASFVAHVIGFSGCYDNEYAIRLMLALARHPNVGAVLSVDLEVKNLETHVCSIADSDPTYVDQ